MFILLDSGLRISWYGHVKYFLKEYFRKLKNVCWAANYEYKTENYFSVLSLDKCEMTGDKY